MPRRVRDREETPGHRANAEPGGVREFAGQVEPEIGVLPAVGDRSVADRSRGRHLLLGGGRGVSGRRGRVGERVAVSEVGVSVADSAVGPPGAGRRACVLSESRVDRGGSVLFRRRQPKGAVQRSEVL